MYHLGGLQEISYAYKAVICQYFGIEHLTCFITFTRLLLFFINVFKIIDDIYRDYSFPKVFYLSKCEKIENASNPCIYFNKISKYYSNICRV